MEDSTRAHGANYFRQVTGTLGYANGFVFYPTTNLEAMGDHGAVATNDATIAVAVRMLRN